MSVRCWTLEGGVKFVRLVEEAVMPGIVECYQPGIGNQFLHDAGISQWGGGVVFSP